MSVFYEALAISVPLLRPFKSIPDNILKFLLKFLEFLYDLFSPDLSETTAKGLFQRAIDLLTEVKTKNSMIIIINKQTNKHNKHNKQQKAKQQNVMKNQIK